MIQAGDKKKKKEHIVPIGSVCGSPGVYFMWAKSQFPAPTVSKRGVWCTLSAR